MGVSEQLPNCTEVCSSPHYIFVELKIIRRVALKNLDIMVINIILPFGICLASAWLFTPALGGGRCPAEFPYAYQDGDFCCNKNKEDYKSSLGDKCNRGDLSYNSKCCGGKNKYCDNRPCVTAGTQQECKCIRGASSNGGKELNTDGYCEFYCSKPYSGKRYCGTGKDYRTGDFIDCTTA